MSQLRVNAVNASFDSGRYGLVLGLLRIARWELTCGLCRERVRLIQRYGFSAITCPYCGTRNLLPVPRFPNDPGPRPGGTGPTTTRPEAEAPLNEVIDRSPA